MSRSGRTVKVRVHPEGLDTLASTNRSTTDFLPNGDFAFVSDVLVSTFTMDSLRHVFQDRRVSQVAPSPNPRFVVIRRAGKVGLLDQKSGSETWITDLSDAPLTCTWSASGDRALITDGRTVGILDVSERAFRKIYTADTLKILKSVVSTADLTRVFWVVDFRTVYAWNASEQKTSTVSWQGSMSIT